MVDFFASLMHLRTVALQHVQYLLGIATSLLASRTTQLNIGIADDIKLFLERTNKGHHFVGKIGN